MKNFHKEVIESCKLMDGYSYALLMHMVYLVEENKFNEWVKFWVLDSDESFDDSFYNAHKALRQTDVFGNPHLDMLFWNHIQVSGKLKSLLESILE